MTDIIERLRFPEFTISNEANVHLGMGTMDDMREAADKIEQGIAIERELRIEIERLRGEIKRLEDEVRHWASKVRAG